MKTKKITPLDNALDFMKARLLKNVGQINSYAETMKTGLSYEERQEVLAFTKKLLAENNELLAVQKLIQRYMLEFRSELSDFMAFWEMASTDMGQLVELTIKGELKLDNRHPAVTNIDFLNKLLLEYQEIENYEKCAEVLGKIEMLNK